MLPAACALSLSIAKRRSLRNFSFHSFFSFLLPTFVVWLRCRIIQIPACFFFFFLWWWVQMKAALAWVPWGPAGREESADSDYTVPPWSRTVCPTWVLGCSLGSGGKPWRLGGKQKLSPLIWPGHCVTLSAYEIYLCKHVLLLLQWLRNTKCLTDYTERYCNITMY